MTGSIVTSTDTDAITSGESTMPRNAVQASATCAGGALRLAYFTAKKTETINNVNVYAVSAYSGGTPTLIRIGIYSVDAGTGDLTLIASTASDTALFATNNTKYTKALQAAWSKVAGQRYAIGILVVTGGTGPTVPCGLNASSADMWNVAPRFTGARTGQTDLPSPTLAFANIANSNFRPYVEMTP